MNFKIFTLGCKVNIYESEAIAYDLKSKGWKEVEDDPDVQIINTCTVTAMSDSKSRKLIRQLIRENPKAITVVMGCYSQLDSDDASNIDGVNIVIGTNHRKEIYELIEQYQLFHQNIVKVEDIKEFKTYEELSLKDLTYHTRGFIKIQDGCENFCTYCAIPYSRGRIKSRSVESTIEEIKILVDKGVKEVVLAGINTGTYGKDNKTISLAGLINKIIEEVPNIYRIRLSSIELKEITDELLDTIVKHQDKVAHHLHIPLQSGCDTVLKRMNRRYLMKDYMERISYIRSLIPDITISTDCLAGFVGETEEEFLETYHNIEKMHLEECHIFPYSKRPHTAAFNFKGHLDPALIKERAHKLQSLAKELKLKFYKKYLNQDIDILFEQEKDGYWIGHSSNYLEVMVKSNDNLENQVLNIHLNKIVNGRIEGRVNHGI